MSFENFFFRGLQCVCLIGLLSGCEQSSSAIKKSNIPVSASELKDFIARIQDDFVYVEGGSFLMGRGRESSDPASPAHEVELSGFSISRYKVTNEEYQFYLRSVGKLLRTDGGRSFDQVSTNPRTPAFMDWYEAECYCNWLKDISGSPISLPTEAQWEYAARSRGLFVHVATDDGTAKIKRVKPEDEDDDGLRGINVSASYDRYAFAKEMGWDTGISTPLTVDRFPPNPLGIYSMTGSGLEWVMDWYDPNYYHYSPRLNPTGPSGPVHKEDGQFTKVLRGASYFDPLWSGALTTERVFSSQETTYESFGKKSLLLYNRTARCVMNSVGASR